jgi:LacI family transcriptional regulator
MSTMRVSPATRARVLQAARELDYTPNPAARALRRQRSNVFGFVPRLQRTTPYEHPVPFLLSVHIARAAVRHGYHIVETSSEPSTSRETGVLVRFLMGQHVDGVIIDSPATEREVAQLVEHRLPVVQLIRPQSSLQTPSVVVDPVPGTTAAVEHLIEAGHRRIGFIGLEGAHPVDRARIDTFRSVLAAHGLGPEPDHTIFIDHYDLEEGRKAARRLLDLPSRPTALFVAGDNLAVGALQIFYAHHVRIPEDLSMISYDDVFAGSLAPPLTSVHQPLETVAEQAIQLLSDALDAPAQSRQSSQVVLPTILVKRGSVQRMAVV